jgi:lysine-N-methylase
MIHRKFPYAERFHCLAGNCPDSCCTGWEIVVDAQTLQTYQTCSEAIGETIRQNLTHNEEQEWIFRNRENGDCPFWNQQQLCDLQIQAGDALLCETCRQFPRIPQDYTFFIEHVLSLACPEAARLILTQEEPFQAIETDDQQPVTVSDTALPYSMDHMECLQYTRSVLLRLLQTTSIPLSDALLYGLHYVQRLQDWIDEKTEDFPTLQPIPATPDFLYTPALQQAYASMEWLTPQWADWMQQIQDHPVTENDFIRFQQIASDFVPAFRNFCSYALFLFWLQAIQDGDVLLQYQKLMAALHQIATVSAWKLRETGTYTIADCILIVQRYAKEILHCAENMERLQAAFL